MYNDSHASDEYKSYDKEYIDNTPPSALDELGVLISVAQYVHDSLAEQMLDNEEDGIKELMTEATFDNLYKDWTKMLTKIQGGCNPGCTYLGTEKITKP